MKLERVLLNRASTSTQFHPPPPTSIQLISTFNQLHTPPPSSLEHSQQYSNQNIARNWAISPDLGRKIQSCPFWLKSGSHGILEVLIPNPHLDFWNPDSKIHFSANLGPKRSNLSALSEIWCTWYLEDADFYFNICFLDFKQKTNFWTNLGQKSQICSFCLKIGTHGISRMRIVIPKLVFSVLKPKSIRSRKWNCLLCLM